MGDQLRKFYQDHGGGIDAAALRFGGDRAHWIDLSTGINPHPYPLPDFAENVWTSLPDINAQDRLVAHARSFWSVPDGAAILAAPGASALIANIPALQTRKTVSIPAPTYNEHAASFANYGWTIAKQGAQSAALVVVNPNNPTGRYWTKDALDAEFCVIDESFCDVSPEQSLIDLSTRPGTLVLKSFGKFWGLAGLRLGFAIGDPNLIARLEKNLGPWPVSGAALAVGALALADRSWAEQTRSRLKQDAQRLDGLMINAKAKLVGGTDLFRLYRVHNASDWQDRLAQHHIWTRIFPYNNEFLRVGLPKREDWTRVEHAVS